MFISDTAIKRPVLTSSRCCCSWSSASSRCIQLDTDEYPEINAPVVVVAIPYPGASPDVVEREVIDPIEEVISGISGVDRMRSNSLDSFANIIVEFDFAKDPQRGDAGDPRQDLGASATTCRRRWRSRSSRSSIPPTGRSCR